MLKFTNFASLWEAADPKKPIKVPANKTLHAFDLDNTLVSHDYNKLRIHVLDKYNNRLQSLSSAEFNNHQLHPDHHYDFREFKSSDAFIKSAKPIKEMINKLNAAHRSGAHARIITARTDMDDQKKFAHHMLKFGIDIGKVHVHRAGNMSGKTDDAKAAIVHELIGKHGYKSVHLYDDAIDNLEKFVKLKKHHPDTEFNAHHVQHDEKSGRVNITTRKV